jgi:hypothetical protein
LKLPQPAPVCGLDAAEGCRLADLALWYSIRAEVSCLRYMPEAMAWLWHQMRRGVAYTPPDAVAAAPSPDPSFFHRSTVLPLYSMLRAGVQSGKPFSRRVNLDDMNEAFLLPEVLGIAYHNCGAGSDDPSQPNPAATASAPAPERQRDREMRPAPAPSGIRPISALRVVKSFYESSSWAAVALCFRE